MKGPRPHKLVVVVGTGTDVGKTWVSAALLAGCRARGIRVAARKPAQSFEPGRGLTDAEVLAQASAEDSKAVCPAHRWYEVPYAPPVAADKLGRPPILQTDLLEELTWPDPAVDLGVVELAGGVASPMSSDRDPLELVRDLAPDHVVLVADASLGVINAVRVSLGYLAAGHPTATSVLVVLNRFDATDDLHLRNARWLREVDGLDIVPSPGGDQAAVAGALSDRMWTGR